MATLVRWTSQWSPWREVDRAFSELSRMMLRDLASWLAEWGDGRTTARSWVPPAEMFRKGDQLILRLDVPGVAPEALEVTVNEEGILTVRGERRWDEGEEVEAFCCERYYGARGSGQGAH